MKGHAFAAATLLFAALCISAPGAPAGTSTRQAVVALPAAGELVVPRVVVRSAASTSAKRVRVLHQFRPR